MPEPEELPELAEPSSSSVEEVELNTTIPADLKQRIEGMVGPTRTVEQVIATALKMGLDVIEYSDYWFMQEDGLEE